VRVVRHGQQTSGEAQKLVLYSGRSEELVGALVTDFTEATGIPVEVRYAGTAELAAQLLEEGDRPRRRLLLPGRRCARRPAAGGPARASARRHAREGASLRTPARAAPVGTTPAPGRLHPDLVPAADLPTSVLDLTDPA
jgi:iron(III) transport system substrate-binding protein